MSKVRWGKNQCALIAITVLVVSMFLCACTEGVTFSGSKAGDEDHFDIAFEMLNTSYSHELEMKEGEALDVMLEAESGNVSLIIRRGEDEPIYRGSNLESTVFQVGIAQEGIYTLTVEGKKARGHVTITRVGG